jgi:hypothetical protein
MLAGWLFGTGSQRIGLRILHLQDPLPDCQRVPPGRGAMHDYAEDLLHVRGSSPKGQFATQAHQRPLRMRQ